MAIPAANTTRGLSTPSENGSRAIDGPNASPGLLEPKALRGEPRVLVAERGVGIRRGIRLVLEGAGLVVCAEVEDAEGAMEAAVRERPDICLLDLELPGGCLQAAEQICKRAPQTAVVILAEEVSDEELFDALRIGASGFVLKGIKSARLPHVLRGVLRGEAALPRELAGRVAQEFRDRARRRYIALPETRGAELTRREWEILGYLREGFNTRQVAGRLGIAQVTVRRHIGELLKKLQVANRAEALELFAKRSAS
jgi:DNA-binding NarL/FixJ family response regulator